MAISPSVLITLGENAWFGLNLCNSTS